MFLIYDLLWFLSFLIASPYVIIKLLSKDRSAWLNRLGFLPGFSRKNGGSDKYIWIHCASVGEVMTAGPFIRNLNSRISNCNIALSVMTAGGYNAAVSLGLPVKKIFFAPFDCSVLTRRVFRLIKPDAFVLVEAEFWPNLVRAARLNGARVFMINARFSKKSEKFGALFPATSRKILGKIELFLAREKRDADWLSGQGVSAGKILVTGNMKYDLLESAGAKSVSDKTVFGFSEKDKIFTAGSVREGEEQPVIDAFVSARQKTGGLKMIFAPRHLGRLAITEKILNHEGIKNIRLSALTAGTENKNDCVVIDSFGRLKDAYNAADAVFVGGGLMQLGGQNIIEPALLGKPVMFGPYMSSFQEPSEVLKKSGGGIVVKNSSEIAEQIVRLVSDTSRAVELGKKARDAVFSMAGATERNLRAITDTLEKNRTNILLIQPSRIGDVVFTLPFLSNLRKMYPYARISWLVDDRCEPLLDGNPHLDEKIIFPFKKLNLTMPFYTLNEIFKLRKILLERDFDLSIDLHGLAKSAFVAAISGAREKIASASTYGMKEFSRFVSKEIPAGSEMQHAIERQFEVLNYLAKNDSKAVPLPSEKFDMEFPLPAEPSDDRYVDEILKEKGIDKSDKIAAVLTGGGWKSRRWLPERFSKACDMIARECGAKIVFIGGAPGGSSEEGIIEDVMSEMEALPYNLAGKLSLKQLIAFLRKCSLYFGNEAGPMHIACALGIPVVAVIGPTNPRRTGPFGNNFKVVIKEVKCAPCKERNCKKLDCMNNITVEDVFEAAKSALKHE